MLRALLQGPRIGLKFWA